MLKISEKRPFFRADMAGLGIYHMGGYGQIGVHRDISSRTYRKMYWSLKGPCAKGRGGLVGKTSKKCLLLTDD